MVARGMLLPSAVDLRAFFRRTPTDRVDAELGRTHHLDGLADGFAEILADFDAELLELLLLEVAFLDRNGDRHDIGLREAIADLNPDATRIVVAEDAAEHLDLVDDVVRQLTVGHDS